MPAALTPTSSPRWWVRPRANATRPITVSATTSTISHRGRLLIWDLLQRVSLQRARHAVATATALAELEPLDRDHLDPGLAHLRDGAGVPFVRHHHARL